jgi:hypothetical protein
MGGTSIWHWPGMRRTANELHILFELLRDAGFAVDRVGGCYDIGLLPDNPRSEVQKWISDPKRVSSDWWIGLSLGAAVAHIVACTIPEPRRPKRVTLINPFADRMELSRHLGFPMGDQWRLKPINFQSPGGILVDLVISRLDDRIPPEHGHRLKDCYSVDDLALFELDADHALSENNQQRLLASFLLSR